MGSLEDNTLVQEPYSKYWDGSLSRREAQRAINKLAANDAELMARVDTVYVVVNFLCEQLGVTKGQIDAYVDKKKAEIAASKTQESQ